MSCSGREKHGERKGRSAFGEGKEILRRKAAQSRKNQVGVEFHAKNFGCGLGRKWPRRQIGDVNTEKEGHLGRKGLGRTEMAGLCLKAGRA